MIGDTAAISLLTGLPGSGKSLRLVQRIVDLVEQGEHVYVTNITGISVPGVTPWEHPSKWSDLPTGAILFVDEAQYFFPARRSGEPPEWVRQLSVIRHSGIRIVLATQQPDYLDSYVRGLVGFHEHLYRQSGVGSTFIFRNHQVMDSLRLPLARIKKMYDHESWKLPKRYFAFYKSAEIHTIAYRMPSLYKRALIAVPVAALIFASIFGYIFKTQYAKYSGKSDASASSSSSGPVLSAGPSSSASSVALPLTTEQYVQQFVPRVHSQPWSAPFYDSSTPPSRPPRVFCMIGGDHDAGTCTCLTEQGTRYWMNTAECRIVATDGQYEPYLSPDVSRDDSPPPPPPSSSSSASTASADPLRTPSPAASASSPGVGLSGWQGQQTRYGQFRTDPIPADPQITGY